MGNAEKLEKQGWESLVMSMLCISVGCVTARHITDIFSCLRYKLHVSKQLYICQLHGIEKERAIQAHASSRKKMFKSLMFAMLLLNTTQKRTRVFAQFAAFAGTYLKH